jgi:hypothetical protein
MCSAFLSSFKTIHQSEVILMMKTEKQTGDRIWLTLRGYHVAALKPEFREAAMALEREINEGVSVHPDPARTDFYDVALEGGSAYIHVHRDRRTVYVIAYCAVHMVDCSFAYGARRKAQHPELLLRLDLPARSATSRGGDPQDSVTLAHAAQPLA